MILKKFNNKQTMLKFAAYIALPSLFLLIELISISLLFNSLQIKTIKNTHASNLELFCINQEKNIGDIASSIRILAENDIICNTVEGNSNSMGDITHTQKVFRKIKSSYSCIDSIAIVEKKSMQVYTTNYIYDFNDFFTNEFVYSNYDYNYWLSFRSPLSERAILSPCKVSASNTTKKLIPIVFTRLGNKFLSNFIIVNIDIDAIVSNFVQNKPSDNSNFYIINKKTHEIFNSSSYSYDIDEGFFDMLSPEKLSVFDYKMNGEKSLIISYTPIRSVFGYIYVTAIPYSDISRTTLKYMIIFSIIGILSVILLLLLIKFSLKKVYTPLESLASLFNNAEDEHEDNVDKLQELVSDTIVSKNRLSTELAATLPILEEQYLIRILNSSSHYYSETVSEDKLNFKYKYFCSVILTLQPLDSFLSKYSSFQKKTIETNLFRMIYDEFSEKFITYVIPSNEYTLYILLNLEDDSEQTDKKINSIIEYLQELLIYDKNDIKLLAAHGIIHDGINGLKLSHDEALANLSKTPWHNSYVKIDDNVAVNTCKFSSKDKDMIYNHLLARNTDLALDIINNIINYNIERNVSKSGLIQIYVSIFNSVFEVLRLKNIEYDKDNVGDIGIISDIISYNISDIHTFLCDLINLLKTNKSDSISIDCDSVIKYIQSHYNEDISLEGIAESFNTSSSYLSRLIKKESGMTFSEYLTILRINCAKQMLETTNKSITEIYESVGYNNRTTFIRLFKSIVGSTPSEYRKIVK